MPVETELYDILEIQPSASINEIKKAYRKLALIHHPDKGGDAEVFKKVTSAYETLSDSEKKEIYDKHGKNGLKGSGSIPDDILNSMFGGVFGGMGGIFNAFSNIRSTIKKAPPVIHQYHVSLEDLCTRKIGNLRYIRKIVCPCVDTTKLNLCPTCKGQGATVTIKQMGLMAMHTQQLCTSCNGKGKNYPSCSNCKEGIRELPKVFTVHLNPSLENGYKYIFHNEGNQDHNQEMGDFIVIIVYKHHSLYQIDGKNLLITVTITLKEALCGHTLTLLHPSGDELVIKDTAIITPKTVKVIKAKGLTPEGNIHVQYEINFPTSLSTEQIFTIQKTL